MSEQTPPVPPELLEPDLATVEMNINMGPQHPSTHGVLRLELTLDGEEIVRAIPDIGFLHRGIEKICETWSIDRAPIMADRADYLSGFNDELVLCLAAERLLGIEVPARASYARVILAELNRLTSHMMFYGAFIADAGLSTGFMYGWILREQLQDLFERISGARLLHHYIAVGGLKEDLPQTPKPFKDMTRELLDQAREALRQAEDLVAESDIFVARARNVNALATEAALELGITGPMLRATGLAHDIRRVAPYSRYDEFEFEIPVGTIGDAYDRFMVRMREMRESIKIVEQALEAMPSEGEHCGELPRVLRLPDGEVYVRTESPRGELGVFLKGDGKANAYRVKLRAPSFSHAAALEALLEGAWIADAVIIGGSTDLVMGEVDR